MYGDNDYRFFSSAYPNDTYENVSVRGAPFDPRVMYPPRGPPPAPSSGRRNDGPHGQPADPAPAHTGFRPASHLSYQAAPWPTSNISASTYTYNNRTYPRYQAGSARPAATAPAQSAPPPSSTGRSTSQPSSSTTHRTPSHTHSGSTATRIQPVRAASSSRETDEITKKNKEIEQQETVLKEIAEDRKKLDTKEQEARLKIANLRNEITALARQQQQREDAQQRAQQIQQHQQQQQLRLQQQQQQQLSGSTTGQVPGYVPPIGTQYQDPRSFASLVNAVRSAPSALPYQSSTNVLSIASVNFSKLNQRYNVITTGDFLRSQVFSKAQLMVMVFPVVC